MNHYLRFRNAGLGATAWCLVLFIIAQTASAQQTIILDNFDDDVGELAGETTTSGHPWLVSSKNEVQIFGSGAKLVSVLALSTRAALCPTTNTSRKATGGLPDRQTPFVPHILRYEP